MSTRRVHHFFRLMAPSFLMGPFYFATNDPLLAYRIGLGAAFIGGLVEMSGALVGPWLERITPRAGMLGTIAGVAIVWIAILIDRDLPKAMLFSLLASFLSLIGLIQADKIGLSLSPIALGYLVLAGLLGLFHLSESRQARIDERQASDKVTAQI